MLDKEAIKEYLIKEKQRLQDQLYAEEGIGRSISLRDNVDELSLADNHPADLGSELFERSKDLSVREKQSYLLNNIELALAKLESGCYGICEHCGQEIMEERLEALPYVRLCIHCQEEEEKQFGSGRPIAVSYTHLDVYKRQVLGGGSLPWPMPVGGECCRAWSKK